MLVLQLETLKNNKEVDQRITMFKLPSKILCKVLNVSLLVNFVFFIVKMFVYLDWCLSSRWNHGGDEFEVLN